MFSARSIGAFFLAALQALNIAANSSYVESPGYELVEYLAFPYAQIDDALDYVFESDRIETDNEFLQRSTIIIDKDAVTIDGVPYTNVWLSNDAAEQFRTEGFDLATAFNLTSHNEGTFVSGAGMVGGVPVYQLGTNVYKSPIYYAESPNQVFETGKIRYYWTPRSEQYPTYRNIYHQYNGGTMMTYQPNYSGTNPTGVQITNTYTPMDKYDYNIGIVNSSGTTISPSQTSRIPDADVDMTPFDFEWTTGQIPADQVLTPETGLNIQVPTQVINNFYIQYPDYDLPNVEIPLVDVDPSLIDDLILPLIPIINTGDANIEFSEHETPTPPAPGTIANEPWESLRRALQDIKESIQQGTTIQQAIKAGQDIIAQLISPINTTLSTINNSIGNLIDKIETGSIDFFRDTIRSIKVPFTRWFGLLAQNLGIWHYVVEWLQYISAPFSWFWNVFSSVNPILISPVYAMFAATLVIAIYRRFGR